MLFTVFVLRNDDYKNSLLLQAEEFHKLELQHKGMIEDEVNRSELELAHRRDEIKVSTIDNRSLLSNRNKEVVLVHSYYIIFIHTVKCWVIVSLLYFVFFNLGL